MNVISKYDFDENTYSGIYPEIRKNMEIKGYLFVSYALITCFCEIIQHEWLLVKEAYSPHPKKLLKQMNKDLKKKSSNNSLSKQTRTKFENLKYRLVNVEYEENLEEEIFQLHRNYQNLEG